MRKKNPVRNANAQHEIRDRLADAAFTAEHAVAIALRIDTPPAQVGSHPFRRNGFVAPLGELPDFLQALPRILFLFQPFRARRSGFFLLRRHYGLGRDLPYSLSTKIL